MWGRKRKVDVPAESEPASALKEAVHQARLEAAERTSVVVDLRDAEWARLQLLNEALDPLFDEIPADVDLFDRGVTRGETPRLWIDAVAHVVMGRDTRLYRFLHRRAAARARRGSGIRPARRQECGGAAGAPAPLARGRRLRARLRARTSGAGFGRRADRDLLSVTRYPRPAVGAIVCRATSPTEPSGARWRDIISIWKSGAAPSMRKIL